MNNNISTWLEQQPDISILSRRRLEVGATLMSWSISGAAMEWVNHSHDLRMRLPYFAPFGLKGDRALDSLGCLHACLYQQVAHKRVFGLQRVIRSVVQLHAVGYALCPAIGANAVESTLR